MSRRLLKRVSVLLLCGAMLNVAVAWTSAVFVSTAQETSLAGWRGAMKQQTSVGWDVFRYEAWSAARIIANGRHESMFNASQKDDDLYPPGSKWPKRLDDLAVAATPTPMETPSLPGGQMLELRGWPMFSMQAFWNGDDRSVDSTKRWRWGISLSSRPEKLSGGVNMNALRVLPFLPLWPGFALNTLIYSLIIWLVFVAPAQLRRRIRRKHHRCPACGYPVGTSEICTECGYAFAPPKSS